MVLHRKILHCRRQFFSYPLQTENHKSHVLNLQNINQLSVAASNLCLLWKGNAALQLPWEFPLKVMTTESYNIWLWILTLWLCKEGTVTAAWQNIGFVFSDFSLNILTIFKFSSLHTVVCIVQDLPPTKSFMEYINAQFTQYTEVFSFCRHFSLLHKGTLM